MRKFVAVTAVGLGCLTAACASLGRVGFKEPIVTLRDVRLAGVGVSGGSVDVVLDVYNPNGYRLDGVRLTYNVLIDTIPMGTGSYDTRFTVEKGDTTQLKFPLTFTYAGLGAAGRQLLNTGSVDYRVKGDVTVATPVGQFTRPYEGRGRFTTMAGRGDWLR